MKLKWHWIFFACAISGILSTGPARASTFVGNGGNAGDVELLVATRQLKDAIRLIANRDETRSLCECPEELGGHPICAYLLNLTSEQRKFCSKVLADKANEIERLLEDPPSVRFEFTHEAIEVETENRLRASDAVANPESGLITINQKRFTDMPPFARVFLLTHEILHFVPAVDGSRFADEKSYGPFEGTDGGRTLLNSMAAATTAEALDKSVLRKYGHALSRPQAWKHWWIDLDGGKGKASEGPSAYAIEKFSRARIQGRYQAGAWGVAFGRKVSDASRTVLVSSPASERIETYSLGAVYRAFPVNNPLSFWGQAHFVLQADLLYLHARYEVSDEFIRLQEETDALEGGISLSYYLPVIWGFWGYLGFGLETQNRQYNSGSSGLRLKYDAIKQESFIGVSYGF